MTTEWIRVSKQQHCPICDHPDWCLISADGTAAICGRVSDGSVKRCGEAGFLHRLTDRPANWRPEARRLVVSPAPADVSALALEYHAVADREGHLDRLAEDLGLSVESLRRFRVGWCAKEGCSTWPMSDASGRIVGVNRRFSDGARRLMPGHMAGLYLPDDLSVEPDAPLVVCEGATDAVAGRDLGFQCVGRFSCTHGVRLLVELVKARRPGLLVTIGNTDEPGRRGAESLAAALLPYVPALKVVEPPAPCKDLRVWRQAGATLHDVHCLIAGVEPRRLAVRVATI
jgi:hypothetical protein